MDPRELETHVDELETRIERLKALYEQYFQGIERLEPQVPRKDVDRRIAILRKEQIRSSTLRFRFQSIIQRYTSYQTLWGRITRQIEEGTYRRDVMKVRQQRIKKAEPTRRSSRPPEWELGVDFEDTDDFFKNLGFDDIGSSGTGSSKRASLTPPPSSPMSTNTPLSMSFARPKDPPRPQSQAPALRPASVPPRAPTGTMPSMPSLGMPRVPSMGPAIPPPPRAPGTTVAPRAPVPTNLPPRAPAPPTPALGSPRVPVPTNLPPRAPNTVAPRAPMPTNLPPRAPNTVAPRAPVPTNLPPRAPLPSNASQPRIVASTIAPRPMTSVIPRSTNSSMQAPQAPKPITPIPRSPAAPKKPDDK